MKLKFRLFLRRGIYYCHDNRTGKQASLQTSDKGEAGALLNAPE